MRLLAILSALVCVRTASAQQWNDPRALALVRQATDRRAQQLADSGLVDYQATAHGLGDYDFALSDSLRISIPSKVIEVYELKVRPKDDRQARLIGSLFLDRENGQVVRMAFSFTRVAYLDKELEDLFVVLENGL